MNPTISPERKRELIDNMVDNMPVLRAYLNISQEKLGKYIGVSRQTIVDFENRRRDMTWPAYLSILFFFSANKMSKKLVDALNLYPTDFEEYINSASNKEIKV